MTAGVSGTWGPWKEVTRQLETLLSGPVLPNDFYTIRDREVSFPHQNVLWAFTPQSVVAAVEEAKLRVQLSFLHFPSAFHPFSASV